ncbi:hypothetical protein T05_15875, partial [Trichinella murrelli]
LACLDCRIAAVGAASLHATAEIMLVEYKMTAVTHAHNFGICRQRPAVHCTRTYDDGKIAIRSCNTIFMYATIAKKMLLDNKETKKRKSKFKQINLTTSNSDHNDDKIDK